MVFVRDALECLITENLSRGSIELPVCRLFINIAAVGPLLKVGETKKSAQTLETQNKKPTMGAADPPNKLFLHGSYIHIFFPISDPFFTRVAFLRFDRRNAAAEPHI